MKGASIEIPEFKPIIGWKKVPITENGEKLILLNDLAPDKILVEPEYFNKNIPGAEVEQYLRAGAAEKLLRAATHLQNQFDPDLKILVYDAFRPLAIQEYIFNQSLEKRRQEHPDWPDQKLREETERYVSIPAGTPTQPAPHSTGGAIDLSIIKGDEQLMMTPSGFDDESDVSRTDFYEKATEPQGLIYRHNRQMLYWVMTQAGFTNYPEEWWLFDFGNQFWAFLKKTIAIYGGAQKFYQELPKS